MEEKSKENIFDKITRLKCCVIIPTYNNENTLRRVIDGVLLVTNNIIIVNDGCTDSTPEILKEYPQTTQIHFPENKGKGIGLQEGFKKALELGYEYAVTIDSDGQHYPDDIPAFITELEIEPNSLIIGARTMTGDSVPKSSSFGHKFSNFWYWAETGVKLTDTQSGFRLYPIKLMKDIKFYTSKFEFEIENIVRPSWRGITVKNIPIKVLYDPDERVSHFRKYHDFGRITILNIWLLVIAFLYIKPRDYFRKLSKKGFKHFFKEDFLHSSDSPMKIALSVVLGVFFGIAPFWGFQTLIVISLSVVFKLNKVIAFAASNVSIAPLIPVIVIASIKVGSLIFGTDTHIELDNFVHNLKLLTNVKEYLVGSFVLATMASLTFGMITYLILKIARRKNG